MQTFMNEPTFGAIVKSLDPVRLRKQFIEARQILDTLLEKPESRWRNHPAVKQWKGYEVALYNYAMEMGWEIKRNGWKYEKNMDRLDWLYTKHLVDQPYVEPVWWTDPELKERVIATHRARLYEKDNFFYEKYQMTLLGRASKICCPHCNYFWPTHYFTNLEKLNDQPVKTNPNVRRIRATA